MGVRSSVVDDVTFAFEPSQVFLDRTVHQISSDGWCAVLAEWNSSNTFAIRVHNLNDGLGGSAHNGSALLLPVVRDDISAVAIDFLNGSSGDDWLILLMGEDKVSGKAEATN
jgi:hypothetical protein